MSQSGFVLRIAPGGQDKLPEALTSGQLIIGWAKADGLLDSTLTWEAFREIVRQAYYADHPTLRTAGAAAGHLWRFIREMKPGDLVVVPYGADFFVTEVSGPAAYDSAKIDEDSAYRRPARWLNGGRPISRQLARSALLSRIGRSYVTPWSTRWAVEPPFKPCVPISGTRLTDEVSARGMRGTPGY